MSEGDCHPANMIWLLWMLEPSLSIIQASLSLVATAVTDSVYVLGRRVLSYVYFPAWDIPFPFECTQQIFPSL